MPSPLTQAGATPEPTQYAPLTMDRYITGLWTQRSPLRDADVPYIYGKFYSASRFDSIIDGINREITARLTLQRRCGTSVFNDRSSFPAMNTFYSFNAVQQSSQQMIVMSDSADNVWDTTPGAGLSIFDKSSGAGTTRFLGLGSTLYFGNGVDAKKWMKPGGWEISTAFDPGTLILPGTAVPGSIYMGLGGVTLNIVASQSTGTQIILTCDTANLPLNFANMVGVNLTFSDLTVATFLNGNTYPIASIDSSTLGILRIDLAENVYAETDEGTDAEATSGNGTTGSDFPTFSTDLLSVTSDGGQQWKCYGSAIQDWGISNPIKKMVVTPSSGTRFWTPKTNVGFLYSVLDPNGNVQVAFNTSSGSPYITGRTYPQWVPLTGGAPQLQFTQDGTFEWANAGPIGMWAPTTAFGFGLITAGNPAFLTGVILDSNQNLQMISGGSGGKSGSTAPTWATGLGDTTSDGALTWKCLGPGVTLSTAPVGYSASPHMIDGSVANAVASYTIQGGILGPADSSIEISLSGYTDQAGWDYWDVWRTAQGGSTLLLLDQASIDATSYTDTGQIADTSTAGGPSLDALIAAPIDSANNPPPAGFTAPVYHMSRVWGIVRNTVYYSGGPDTIVGNGNTAFAPLSSFRFPEFITRLMPITVNNGGLLCMGTRNVYIILGTGTPSNPFYDTTYMPTVGFLNYDAMTMVGSTIYGFTNNRKFVSLDPSAGYVECGFPIGDQFNNVTTGNAFGGVPVGALYDPAKTYVTWNERESGDSGIYVSDGAVGWFRYSPVAAPESGYLWSPRAVIGAGTSAVLSVETSPGVQTLLIGPSAAAQGPILQRDPTVFTDWSNAAATNYSASYVTIGSIVLCEPGEVAEVAFVTLDSIRTGAQPQVGMLYGEISATTNVPFDMIDVTSPDPPDLPESETLYSDRYVTMHDGVCPKCRHCQVMVSWPAQSEGDELLAHAIYGAKFAERKEQ